MTWEAFYSGLEPQIPFSMEFLFKEKYACGMLLLQRRLCKPLNFAQDIQVHRKLFVTSIATQLSVLMLIKWYLIDLLIIAQRIFLNLRFFAFVLLKEKHNEPHFDIMRVLSHQLMCWGFRSQEYFPHGRKPVKINFLTSCSYKKCCLWLHSNLKVLYFGSF